MRDGSSARSFAILAVGMMANRVALALAVLLPAPLLHAATASIEGNVVQVLATGDGRFGGCMAALDVELPDVGLDCSGSWVTFSCTGEHAEKEDAHRMFESLRAAVVADKSVEMRVTDEKKHGQYCHASRIKIQDEPDVDEDSDGDGVLDLDDDVPLDASETVDTDDDGVGNNADTDDDNDGVSDADDAFPLDANESVDTDGDGVGDNEDTDDDNDGVSDTDDACPLDSDVTCGQDHAALVALYLATNGPNWVNNDNWLTNAPLGDWYGVNTDSSGRVVRLDLRGRWDSDAREYIPHGLSGPVPSELGNLANLTRLDLAVNDLSGPIPPELGRLADLRTLDLGRNDLTGPIPTELGELVSLTELWLYSNSLTGLIPESFLALDALEWFRFEWNADLCAPGTIDFVTWREGIEYPSGPYCNESDMGVLNLLYETFGGPDWTNSGGWLETPALDEWYGVTTDALGRVVTLDLSRNGLAGHGLGILAGLAHMTELRIAGNTGLSGRLPLSLADLSLRALHYAGTELCAPDDASFQAWLDDIASHEGTGTECAPLSDREILEVFHDAAGGQGWVNSDNWRTDRPLGTWHGVEADGEGRVISLQLWHNGISGPIPWELGGLEKLEALALHDGRLTGPIPGALGNLANLKMLELSQTDLEGPIPPELGGLGNLTELRLWGNELEGSIPPELGDLANLEALYLGGNDLTGPIPPELGDLANLRQLGLQENELTGPVPPELGSLASLEYFEATRNDLSGPIPPELGSLANLINLFLDYNELSGPVPPEFRGLSNLSELGLTQNAGLEGPLPAALTDLTRLSALLAGGTQLCAPSDPAFQAWLEGVRKRRITPCRAAAPSMAYLTQAVQSRQFPVPLVAGEKALLRVFPVARQATSEGIPLVRARFYLDGQETYVVDIPGKSAPIPTELDESSLLKSANAVIPAEAVKSGLEMVIDVDPEGTLDTALAVAKRIPETGRLPVDVRAVPLFGLTLIPFIWSETQDSSIVELIDEIAADPENHELLSDTRDLLPVRDLTVTAHDPVLTSSSNGYVLISEVAAIWALEGGTGHYMAMMSTDDISREGPAGIARLGGRYSFLAPYRPDLVAHELGHNFSLRHAPCGSAGGPDPSYPYPDGSIGVWGYDFRDGGTLVSPGRRDLMAYCQSRWISDYHFTNALRYRLVDEGTPAAAAFAASTPSLLLWGGVSADSVPFLEPAFVVEAPPALPDSAGDYVVTGRTASSVELFSLSFTMPEVADGDGSSSFAFVLPLQSEWEGNLASITLAGPGGSFTLDGESDLPMAILRNPRTGQVQGILRNLPQADAAAALAPQAGPDSIDVLFGRGIPDAAAWGR